MINKQLLLAIVLISCIFDHAALQEKGGNVDHLLKKFYLQNIQKTDLKTEVNPEQLIPKLKKIFEEEGVPTEWVWLVEIESDFKIDAKSVKGAKGLFQFVPETAKRFGLKIGREDERLNPEKSARAAAKYLKFLYEKFGNWRLALAAYNAGEGRVEKLLQVHNGKTFDHISFDLPSETRHYVMKVLDIVKSRENLDPQKLPAPKLLV
jgi:membrane-bound lytic murein transglycosylase D